MSPKSRSPPRGRKIEARLKELPPDSDKAATSATKALRAAYEERTSWLDALTDALAERAKAEHPKTTPEKLISDAGKELDRLRAVLDQSKKNPDVLLPAVFKTQPTAAGKLPDSAQSEMKEAIDATQTDLNDKTAKLAQFRADQLKKPGASLRAERDKAIQHLAALKARDSKTAPNAADAKTPEALRLARELRINVAWEQRRGRGDAQGQGSRAGAGNAARTAVGAQHPIARTERPARPAHAESHEHKFPRARRDARKRLASRGRQRANQGRAVRRSARTLPRSATPTYLNWKRPSSDAKALMLLAASRPR